MWIPRIMLQAIDREEEEEEERRGKFSTRTTFESMSTTNTTSRSMFDDQKDASHTWSHICILMANEIMLKDMSLDHSLHFFQKGFLLRQPESLMLFFIVTPNVKENCSLPVIGKAIISVENNSNKLSAKRYSWYFSLI